MSHYTSTPQGPYGAPTEATSSEQRTWATLAHIVPLVAMLLSAGTLGFVGSLIIYLMYKDRGAFVRQHAATSLNVQITMFIGLVISALLMFIMVGFVTYAACFVVAFVLHVMGAIRANRGEAYIAPLTLRLVR